MSSAEDDNVSSALVNTLVPTSALEDVCNSMNAWNLHVISQFVSEKYQSSILDWGLIARCFDFPEFIIRDKTHLKALLTMHKTAAKMDQPLQPTFAEWKNRTEQLELVVIAPPEIYYHES